MLLQFFALLMLGIIVAFIISTIKIALPMKRFITTANALINLYDSVFKIILEHDFSINGVIRIWYEDDELEFSSKQEASVEFEKRINQALEYYDMLGNIGNMDNNLMEYKNRLLNILAIVRTARWRMQRI